MIKLSVSETKWSSLLATTRALILYISIWIFDFGPEKLPGLLRNEPQARLFKSCWIVIYPVDNAIHLLSNWSQQCQSSFIPNLQITYLILNVYWAVDKFLCFVLDAPKTFLSSKRLIAEEKQNVTIACTASGQPQPRITWSKSFGSSPKDRAEVVNGTLKISNVAKTDGGTYLCNTKNIMGSKTDTAQLTIFSPLRFKVRPPQALTPMIDVATVPLPCLAESDLKTIITWTKDGKSSLPVDSDVLQNGTLILRNIKKSHEGSYTCKATNTLTTKETKVKISVPVPTPSCSMIKKYVSSKTSQIQMVKEVWNLLQLSVTWLTRVVLARQWSITTVRAEHMCSTNIMAVKVVTRVTFITQEWVSRSWQVSPESPYIVNSL